MQDTSFLEQFDAFLLALHASLDLREVLLVTVNDGRQLLDCDRLSVAIKTGNRYAVHAVSGQDKVVAKSRIIALMAKVAREAIRANTEIHYRGDLTGYPPHLEELLTDYLLESHSRMATFLPLRKTSGPSVYEEEMDAISPQSRQSEFAFGCLVIELMDESEPTTGFSDRAELFAEHVTTAIQNALTHESIFLRRPLLATGCLLRWFRGRRLYGLLVVLLITVLAFFVLKKLPLEYRVEAEGKLLPVIRQEIFAPWDGAVIQVFVRDGQTVEKGSPLLQLENDELRATLILAQTAVDEKRKLVALLQSQLDRAERTDDRENSIRLQGELTAAQIQLLGAEENLSVADERIEHLCVRSPITGVVAAYAVERTLYLRPVDRGERLLEIADPDGSWQLELEIPEHRCGHVLKAFGDSPAPHFLPIQFVLATSVEQKFTGRVVGIAMRTDQSEDQGTVLCATAEIDYRDIPQLHLGSEVRAKIECGKRSAGYVLFGDIVEFFQRHLLF